jgi:hypothetical protein
MVTHHPPSARLGRDRCSSSRRQLAKIPQAGNAHGLSLADGRAQGTGKTLLSRRLTVLDRRSIVRRFAAAYSSKMNKASTPSAQSDPVHDALMKLVDAHKKLKAEPLHLAVHFQRPKNKHVNLFEILGGFGRDEPSADKKFFEIAFASTRSFELPAGKELRLLLTSPAEFERAMAANWASLKILRDSKKAGTATVLYEDKTGKKLWKALG